jgi:hypothetical protein
LAGICSQLLQANGQNLGVGGPTGSQHEAFFATASLLRENVDGVWIVWSAWDNEPTGTALHDDLWGAR